MRLSAAISIVLVLHMYCVCGESTTPIAPPQATEKRVVAQEKSDPNVAATKKLLAQKAEQVGDQVEEDQSTSSSQEDSVESYDRETSKKTVRSVPYETGMFRSARSLHDTPVLVQTYGSNGEISPCSCVCPSSQAYGYGYGSDSYGLPSLPLLGHFPKHFHKGIASYPASSQYPSYSGYPSYAPSAPNYAAPAYPYARNAPNDDETELRDSMTEEARSRSAYAEQPAYPSAAYPSPAPAAPQYSYPSPAPNVQCGQNLLVGCAPTVRNVPCQPPAPHAYAPAPAPAQSYGPAPAYQQPSAHGSY